MNAAIPVKVVQVSESGNATYYDECNAGTAEPVQRSDPRLRAILPVSILRMAIKWLKGQKLYTIDPANLPDQLRAALAQVAVQETNVY